MLVPDNSICPLCGQRDVSTLDHYLPKAKNPSLAVTPINLVPACKECNHVKLEHHPAVDYEQLIHPYYDSLPKSIWLVADLEQTRPPALKYRISAGDDCGEVLKKRLAWHFEKFGLAKLYASQAGNVLSGISNKLRSAWERGGKDEVRFVLNDDAKSWGKHNKNCWQAVMFRTLANSDWFCDEGFNYAGEKRKVKLE
ncbi:HNH endonuclease [compost metagenome]